MDQIKDKVREPSLPGEMALCLRHLNFSGVYAKKSHLNPMQRILAIDYGKKRTGLAWTDVNQIIATALETVDTSKLKPYLKELLEKEPIGSILLGFPTRNDGSDTHITQEVRDFEGYLKKTWPDVRVELWDERFSSKMAMQAMLDGGLSKKKRREKGQVDKIAATLMLQEFLGI